MTPARAGTLVVVDLSNLCRDDRFLPPGVGADLTLFDKFIDATSELSLGHVTALSIADRSLLHLLSDTQRRQAKAMEKARLLELTAIADERILDIAFGPASGDRTLVASLDNFDDFRRAFPIIQGSRDRFLGWEAGERGQLVVTRRNMGHHTHHRLSRKEESAELKARRLRRETLVRQATERHYVCTNRNCLLAQLWPDSIPDLPRWARAMAAPSETADTNGRCGQARRNRCRPRLLSLFREASRSSGQDGRFRLMASDRDPPRRATTTFASPDSS